MSGRLDVRLFGRRGEFSRQAFAPNAGSARARREAAIWLVRMERRVILPVKWAIWLLSFLYWHESQGFPGWPEPPVFGVFFFYLIANIGHSYLCLVSGVAEEQVRTFSLVSLSVDVGCVLAIVRLLGESYAGASAFESFFSQDFYIFFCLLVLRGLMALRGPVENLVYGVLLTLGFVGVAWSLERSLAFVIDWAFAFRVAMVWVVFVIGWALIDAARRQQDEVVAMRERLVRNEDMALLGEVSAGVAHEINNPIAIIAACADFQLQTLPPEASDAREEAEIILAEARRCKSIVRDLLDFAAPEQSGELAEIDLRRLCDEALAPLLSRDWTNPPRVERLHDEPVHLVRGDPRKLDQVIRNILSNARHFAGPAGRLTLCAYSAPGGRGEPWTAIEIGDSGPGIPSKHLPHIFSPFFSRRKGGTGLGLAIARRIVEAHGGRIEARPGGGGEARGAIFVVSLPALAKLAPNYEPPPESPK